MKARPFHEPSTGESDEWYTPWSIFTALKLEFDLDPAHPGLGTPHCCVPTQFVYTPQDNGLLKPWFGLVWLNGPFGTRNSHIVWLRRFFAHAGGGVALARAYTSSRWFHETVVPYAQSMLFPKGKTQFVRADGSVGREPGHGVVLLGQGEVARAALKQFGLGFYIDVRHGSGTAPDDLPLFGTGA